MAYHIKNALHRPDHAELSEPEWCGPLWEQEGGAAGDGIVCALCG